MNQVDYTDELNLTVISDDLDGSGCHANTDALGRSIRPHRFRHVALVTRMIHKSMEGYLCDTDTTSEFVTPEFLNS